jgi:8-oxo-dGTP pyrophosphatase MutT (NUDIX family)
VADLTVARRFVVDAIGPDATRGVIVDFIDAHPDALLRSCVEGHLTGSTLLVHPTRPKVLLMHHRKLGGWYQMGGHADGEGDLHAVALKEALEETGLDELTVLPRAVDLDVHRVEPPGEVTHLHLDVRFAARAPSPALPPGNRESHELRWFAFDDVVDPGIRRLAAAAVALLA